MAYDIGPRIGIDGEAEFRRQLQQVNTSIKTLGSEMKAVTSAFIGQEDSVEALAAQNAVLTKSINAQKEKLQQQQMFLDRAREKFGDNADETQKWQRAVNESTAELNRLEAQLRDNERRMESFGDETEDVGNSLDEAGDAGLNFGQILKAEVIGGAIVEGIKAIGSAVIDLASELWNLDEATAEYRAEQGKLVTAFETNGHSAETANKAYSSLYKVIGDSGEATEAAQLLANLAKSTADVDKWAKIAAGSTGRFGDALPITSLIEAANEAAKTGESVSALDDALNWIGMDAEAFGKTLAATATEEERLQLITDTLSAAYSDAADAFYETNEELLQARENEQMLMQAQAALGESVSKVKNKLISEFAPSILEVANAFSDMLTGVEGSDERFAEAVQGLIETGAEKLPRFIELGADMVFSLINGLLSDPEALANSALEIVGKLGDSIVDNLPTMLAKGVLLVLQLAVGLVKGITQAVQRVPEVVEGIADEFWNHRGEFVEIGKDFVKAIGEGLESMSNWLWENAQGLLEGINVGVTGTGPTQFPGPTPAPAKTGLNYVPYDGYLAELHKGEMVLTARQAEMIRGTGVNNTSMQNVAAAMVNGMQTLVSPMNEGPTVINLVTPEGDVMATWQLPALIRVADAAGTPIVSTS